MATQAAGGAIGLRYALPALQYKTTVVRRLTKCEPSAEGLVLDFDVAVEATPEMIDGEWFTIDYRDLASWSKTSSFDLETYPNQTLKSFNAKADDQSGEIAVSAIKAGFTAARIAAGLPPGGVGAAVPPPGAGQLLCPTAKLKAYDELKQSLEKRTKSLNDLNAELEPYVVQGLIATLSEADKGKISELRTKIITETKALADIKKKMEELGSQLSWTETHEFLPRSGGAAAGSLQPSSLDLVLSFPSLRDDLRRLQVEWARRLFQNKPSDEQLQRIGRDMKPVVLTVRPAQPQRGDGVCTQAGVEPGCAAPEVPQWNQFVSATADPKPKMVPGIVYRTPLRARLRICRSADAGECAAGTSPQTVTAESLTAVPQLGRLGVLPFRNGFAQNNELSATFRADGSIDKASYAEKRARGKVVADLASGSLDEALVFDQALRARRKEEREAADAAATAALDREIEAATKQRDLLDAQWALDPNNLASQRELAIKNSEIALLQAQKTLRELEQAGAHADP